MGPHGSQVIAHLTRKELYKLFLKLCFSLTPHLKTSSLPCLTQQWVVYQTLPLVSLLCVCVHIHTISLCLHLKTLPFLQDTPQTLVKVFPGSHPHSQGEGNPFLSLSPKSLICYLTSQTKILLQQSYLVTYLISPSKFKTLSCLFNLVHNRYCCFFSLTMWKVLN